MAPYQHSLILQLRTSCSCHFINFGVILQQLGCPVLVNSDGSVAASCPPAELPLDSCLSLHLRSLKATSHSLDQLSMNFKLGKMTQS